MREPTPAHKLIERVAAGAPVDAVMEHLQEEIAESYPPDPSDPWQKIVQDSLQQLLPLVNTIIGDTGRGHTAGRISTVDYHTIHKTMMDMSFGGERRTDSPVWLALQELQSLCKYGESVRQDWGIKGGAPIGMWQRSYRGVVRSLRTAAEHAKRTGSLFYEAAGSGDPMTLPSVPGESAELAPVLQQKFDQMLRGIKVVVSTDELDAIEALDHPDIKRLASIPNPKRIGTKDTYLAWIKR